MGCIRDSYNRKEAVSTQVVLFEGLSSLRMMLFEGASR
jgi:hypothetical protein